MLNRPPPMEMGPGWLRIAATMSSVVVGRITAATRIGFNCVTSFTIGAESGCETGVRRMPQTAIPYASTSVAPTAASKALPTRRVARQSVRDRETIVSCSFTAGSREFGGPASGPALRGATNGAKAGGGVRGAVRSGGCIGLDASDDDVHAHDGRRSRADDVGLVRHEQTR